MRHRTIGMILGGLMIVGTAVFAFRGETRKETKPAKGIAVVELFTSEGCSSCPPADKVLAALVARGEKEEQPIFCLGFHVDYWNRLGWPDRFSDRAHTQRQKSYAKALRLRSIYTPQMIVNGTQQFVGSNSKRAAQAVATALKTPASAKVRLNVRRMKEGKELQVAYEVTGRRRSPRRNAVLHVALTEGDGKSRVQRGENAGRTLRHVNVVRAFRTTPLARASKGQLKLPLPADIQAEELRLIAYVQDTETMQIHGATSTTLKGK